MFHLYSKAWSSSVHQLSYFESVGHSGVTHPYLDLEKLGYSLENLISKFGVNFIKTV